MKTREQRANILSEWESLQAQLRRIEMTDTNPKYRMIWQKVETRRNCLVLAERDSNLPIPTVLFVVAAAVVWLANLESSLLGFLHSQ